MTERTFRRYPWAWFTVCVFMISHCVLTLVSCTAQLVLNQPSRVVTDAFSHDAAVLWAWFLIVGSTVMVGALAARKTALVVAAATLLCASELFYAWSIVHSGGWTTAIGAGQTLAIAALYGLVAHFSALRRG